MQEQFSDVFHTFGLVDGDGALNVFDVVWHDGGVFDGVDGWDGAITF